MILLLAEATETPFRRFPVSYTPTYSSPFRIAKQCLQSNPAHILVDDLALQCLARSRSTAYSRWLFLHNAEGMDQACCLSKHGSCPTVSLFRKMDSSYHCFWLHVMASDDMLNGNGDKHHWVLFCAYARYTHFVGSHRYAFLAQNGDDVHSGTACQANEQHFHRAKALILPSALCGCVKGDMMAGA